RGGNGRLSGKVSWPGEPWAMELATLDGRLNLALSQGQFLKAEPGIGRLLGILSLQSLPRRLLLDFRDIFQQGFAFDDVRGDILLSRGRATTDELRMTGVQATVLIGGSADLVKETQDLRVLIVPEVNAGAASLAYLAVNPAVGLGTFLAQLVLRDPLRAAGSREFLVTGSMADPKVERVERAGGAPQALPTPPPPASGPASAVPAPSTTPR
ncbi:MAG: AsmA-like C-terminal region-containing protein, partial [Rubrivivax sp.]